MGSAEVVEWPAIPDDETPHVVYLEAALNNRKESEHQPSTPWV